MGKADHDAFDGGLIQEGALEKFLEASYWALVHILEGHLQRVHVELRPGEGRSLGPLHRRRQPKDHDQS